MRTTCWLALGGLLVALAVGHSQPLSPSPAAAQKDKDQDKEPAKPFPFDMDGHTQCVPERKALIAPVPLHPVVEILASVGTPVKKDQVIVRLDDDEPKADLRNKEALLKNAKVVLQEAKRYLAKVESAYERGALPETSYFQARTAMLRAEHDVDAAEAAVASSAAELEHYEIPAMIDGVVNRLDVHLGAVSRPGTTTWGEIIDLSEIDVRVEVTPEQADLLAAGQWAEVRVGAKHELVGRARVVFVGLAADAKTGRIPVLVRVDNEEGRLRCGVPARVRFLGMFRRGNKE
jgi:cobalt-zinc-cadmium efflux system membrane fusion protein